MSLLTKVDENTNVYDKCELSTRIYYTLIHNSVPWDIMNNATWQKRLQ